jgi:phosphatidylglycerophosphatase A
MQTARLSFRHPAAYISTWFGSGFFPIAPGTAGSLVAVPMAWLVLYVSGPYGSGVLFLATLLVFGLGVWASEIYSRRAGVTDPKEVVVDEVAGQWLALIFAVPGNLWMFAVGFVLFRIFDIWKPWPANWADKHLAGGWGIMLDDIVAGIYAAAIGYGLLVAMESEDVQRLIQQHF